MKPLHSDWRSQEPSDAPGPHLARALILDAHAKARGKELEGKADSRESAHPMHVIMGRQGPRTSNTNTIRLRGSVKGVSQHDVKSAAFRPSGPFGRDAKGSAVRSVGEGPLPVALMDGCQDKGFLRGWALWYIPRPRIKCVIHL